MCDAFHEMGYCVELLGYRIDFTSSKNLRERYSLNGNFIITLIHYLKIPYNLDLILFACVRVLFQRSTIYTRNIAIAFFVSFISNKIILEIHQPEHNIRNLFLLKFLIF